MDKIKSILDNLISVIIGCTILSTIGIMCVLIIIYGSMTCLLCTVVLLISWVIGDMIKFSKKGFSGKWFK